MVVKKVSSKAVSKKTSTKKTAKKQPKQMVQVSGDLCFWVNNGPILSSLKDLDYALKHMSDEQFKHHVAKDKNDFAVWVRGVLFEEACSKKLQKAKTKKEALLVVEETVKQYA